MRSARDRHWPVAPGSPLARRVRRLRGLGVRASDRRPDQGHRGLRGLPGHPGRRRRRWSTPGRTRRRASTRSTPRTATATSSPTSCSTPRWSGPTPRAATSCSPALASSWTVSPDGKTYTFTLREGVKFSNGQPLTAEDVKWSLDRFGDPKTNQLLANVAVRLRLLAGRRPADRAGQPHPAGRRVPLQHQHLPGVHPAEGPRRGAGRRRSTRTRSAPGRSWSRSSRPARTSPSRKNPNYWESGKPYLDEVRFNFATDSNSRLLALQGGQAQIADGVLFSQIEKVQADKDLAAAERRRCRCSSACGSTTSAGRWPTSTSARRCSWRSTGSSSTRRSSAAPARSPTAC